MKSMSDSPDKQDALDVVSQLEGAAKSEGDVESEGADERGTASVDAPVIPRRKLQYSLRSLFFLALVSAGLFWTLRVLAQSGQNEEISEQYILVVFAAVLLSITAIPLIFLAHAIFYAVAQLLAKMAGPSDADPAIASSSTQPIGPNRDTTIENTNQEATHARPASDD